MDLWWKRESLPLLALNPQSLYDFRFSRRDVLKLWPPGLRHHAVLSVNTSNMLPPSLSPRMETACFSETFKVMQDIKIQKVII
jgi:hypothetical protein